MDTGSFAGTSSGSLYPHFVAGVCAHALHTHSAACCGILTAVHTVSHVCLVGTWSHFSERFALLHCVTCACGRVFYGACHFDAVLCCLLSDWEYHKLPAPALEALAVCLALFEGCQQAVQTMHETAGKGLGCGWLHPAWCSWRACRPSAVLCAACITAHCNMCAQACVGPTRPA